MLLYVSIELNVDSDVMSRKFPGVEVQPIVWDFNLITVDDLLFENTVLVSESIAPGWVVHGGQAVKETSCEAAKTSVTERSIMFLRDHILDPEA